MNRDDIIRKVREDDLQRAYERGYRAGIAAEREACAALLEALKGIVAMWDHHCYAHGDGQPTPLHVKARAAIAAVEGEM